MKYLLILTIGLAGCSPRFYESAPIYVYTPQGEVVCQLYTKEEVLWDRSINRPDSMSVQKADNICINEGYSRRSN